MLADSEHGSIEEQAPEECLDCGRSVIARFGGTPAWWCTSCASDQRRMEAAAEVSGDEQTG